MSLAYEDIGKYPFGSTPSTTTATGRLPYDQWLATLSKEQLVERALKKKAGTKKPYKKTYTKKGRGGGRVQAGPFATFYGYGEYSNRDPMKKIDPRTDYAFAPDYGRRLGATLGEGIQSFAHALGFGDYHIQENCCLSHRYIDMGTSPPRVKNTNRGEATVVSHREYLGELLTGTGTPSAFTLQEYALNIGNPNLFPFGSKLAENFQEWEVRGMLIELKSEASNTSTTLNMGSMFIAVDYNALDYAPTNKIELENLEYACSNKPSESILMPVECKRSNDVLTHLYVSVNGDYQGGDKRLYDLGNVFIGSYGCPAAGAPIAEIWVTYEIAFFKPRLFVETPSPPLTLVNSAHWVGIVTGPDQPPFLSPTLQEGSSTEWLLETEGEWSILHLPDYPDDVRQYLVTAWWRTAGTITTPTPPNIVSDNVVISTNFWSGIATAHAQNYAYTPASTLINSDSFSWNFVIKTTGEGGSRPSIQFSGGIIVPPATHYSCWDLVVSRIENEQLVRTACPGRKFLHKRKA